MGRTDERAAVDADFQLEVHRGVEALQFGALGVVGRLDLGHGLDEAQGEARQHLHVIRHVRVGNCRAGGGGRQKKVGLVG